MSGCVVIDLANLPGGNCAQWFSGTASALAVCLALGGYFIQEFRLRRESRIRNSEAVSQIHSVLSNIYESVWASNKVTSLEPEKFSIANQSYQLLPNLRSMRSSEHLPLDAFTSHYLTRTGHGSFSQRVRITIQEANHLNEMLRAYSLQREKLTDAYNTVLLEGNLDDPNATAVLSAMAVALQPMSTLLAKSVHKSLREVEAVCKEFNEIEFPNLERDGFQKVDLDWLKRERGAGRPSHSD